MKYFLCSPPPSYLPHWHFYVEGSIWAFQVQINDFLCSRSCLWVLSLLSHDNVFPILIIQPLLISNCLLSQHLLSKPASSLPLKPFSLLPCLHPCCFMAYSENKSRFLKYSSNHVFRLLQIIQWLLISFKVKVKVKYLTVDRLLFYWYCKKSPQTWWRETVQTYHLIILEFYWANIEGWTGLSSFLEALGKICFLAFSACRGLLRSWALVPFYLR